MAKLKHRNIITLNLPDSVLLRLQSYHPELSGLEITWLGIEALLGADVERPERNKFGQGQANPNSKKSE
jgi:hypothetical protein